MSALTPRRLCTLATLVLWLGACAGGASDSSDTTAGDAKKSEAPTELVSVQLVVDGMHCESCSEAITAEVRRLDGVAGCTVDHVSGSASVQYDPKRVKPPQMVAAIDRLGYEAAVAPAK